MRDYFGTSPPSAHQMVVTLEKRGFISWVPGKARAIRVLMPSDELPAVGGSDMDMPAPSAAPQVEPVVRLAERAVSKMFDKNNEAPLGASALAPWIQCVADAVEAELRALGHPDATSARDHVVAFAVSKYVALCAANDPKGANAQEDEETFRSLLARGRRPKGHRP